MAQVQTIDLLKIKRYTYYMKSVLKKLSKKGFTLAETLITLAIVGVVAAIVIPIVFNQTNIEEYRTMLKKHYSTLSQAISSIANENGGYIDTSSVDNFMTALSTKISFVKTGTWADISNLPSDFAYTCYKNKTGTCNNTGSGRNILNIQNYGGNQAALLKDGATILIKDNVISPTCTSGNYHVKVNSNETLPMNNCCTTISLDVNGNKGPNMLGVDLHSIYLLKENDNYYLLPCGANYMIDCSKDYPDDYNKSLHCSNRMLQNLPMP